MISPFPTLHHLFSPTQAALAFLQSFGIFHIAHWSSISIAAFFLNGKYFVTSTLLSSKCNLVVMYSIYLDTILEIHLKLSNVNIKGKLKVHNLDTTILEDLIKYSDVYIYLE